MTGISVSWKSASASVAEDVGLFNFTVNITGDIDSSSITTIQLSFTAITAGNSYNHVATVAVCVFVNFIGKNATN